MIKLFLINVATALIGLIYTPLLTRELGAGYGHLALLLLAANILSSLDSNRSIITNLFISRNYKLPIFSIIFSQFIYLLLLTFIFYLIGLFFKIDNFSSYAIMLILSMLSSIIYGVLDGLKKVEISAVVKLLFWFFLYSMLYFSSFLGLDGNYFYKVFILSFLLQFVILICIIKRFYSSVEFVFDSDASMVYFLNMLKLTLFNVITMFLSSFDRAIIGSKLGEEKLAYYSVQSETILKAGIFYRTITSYLYPRLTANNYLYKNKIYNYYFVPVRILLFFVYISIDYLPYIFSLYSGYSQEELGTVSAILSTAFALSWYGFSSVNILNSNGNFFCQVKFYILQFLILVMVMLYVDISLVNITLLVLFFKASEYPFYLYLASKYNYKLTSFSLLMIFMQISLLILIFLKVDFYE